MAHISIFQMAHRLLQRNEVLYEVLCVYVIMGANDYG